MHSNFYSNPKHHWILKLACFGCSPWKWPWLCTWNLRECTHYQVFCISWTKSTKWSGIKAIYKTRWVANVSIISEFEPNFFLLMPTFFPFVYKLQLLELIFHSTWNVSLQIRLVHQENMRHSPIPRCLHRQIHLEEYSTRFELNRILTMQTQELFSCDESYTFQKTWIGAHVLWPLLLHANSDCWIRLCIFWLDIKKSDALLQWQLWWVFMSCQSLLVDHAILPTFRLNFATEKLAVCHY